MDLIDQYEEGGDSPLAEIREAVRKIGERLEGIARDIAAQSSQLGVRLDALETAVGQLLGSEALGVPIERAEGGGKKLDAAEQRLASLAEDVGELLGTIEGRVRKVERTIDDRLAALHREIAAAMGDREAPRAVRDDEVALMLEEALRGVSRRKRARVLDQFRAAVARRRGPAPAPPLVAAPPPAPARVPEPPPVRAPEEAAEQAPSAAALAARALAAEPATREPEKPARAPRPRDAKPAVKKPPPKKKAPPKLPKIAPSEGREAGKKAEVEAIAEPSAPPAAPPPPARPSAPAPKRPTPSAEPSAPKDSAREVPAPMPQPPSAPRLEPPSAAPKAPAGSGFRGVEAAPRKTAARRPTRPKPAKPKPAPPRPASETGGAGARREAPDAREGSEGTRETPPAEE